MAKKKVVSNKEEEVDKKIYFHTAMGLSDDQADEIGRFIITQMGIKEDGVAFAVVKVNRAGTIRAIVKKYKSNPSAIYFGCFKFGEICEKMDNVEQLGNLLGQFKGLKEEIEKHAAEREKNPKKGVLGIFGKHEVGYIE